MDYKAIFNLSKLNKTELLILEMLSQQPDYWIDNGIRDLAKQCHSSPSTIIRLSQRIGFKGFIELAYFIKFNVCDKFKPAQFNSISEKGYIDCYPENALETLINALNRGGIIIHADGFSETVANYIYNKLLTIGVRSYLSNWLDMDVLLSQRERLGINVLLIISKSGLTKPAIQKIQSAKQANITTVSFVGNGDSDIAKLSDCYFLFKDIEKFDRDIYHPNPFFSYCLMGIEYIAQQYFSR